MNSAGPLVHAKGILFDMDGVLLDSEPVHERAIVALSGELGDPITDRNLLFSFKGAPEKSMAATLRAIYPSSALSEDEIILRKIDLYAGLFEQVRLIPGAREFLAKVRDRGLKTSLTTSASRSTQRLAFETFQLGEYFDAVITGEDITRGKPHPEPYLLSASRLGLDPKDCVVIEDSINGVRSGHAAGCRVIALTTTFPRPELERAGARHIVDSFREIDRFFC